MILRPADFHEYNPFGLTLVTPEAYRNLIAKTMEFREARTGRKPQFPDDITTPILAYISNNKWIIICECGAANMVHPDWKMAGCMECGRIHTNVIIPSNFVAIEAVLEKRLEWNRNFLPQKGEDIETLKRENRDHGLPD